MFRRRYLSVIFCCLAAASGLRGQSARILSPMPGETLYVGDTIPFFYETDSLFNDKATGMVLYLSPNEGLNWFVLCPIERSDFCPIPVGDSLWGRPHVVVPESVSALQRDGSLLTLSAVTSTVMLRVCDYVDAHTLKAEMAGTLTVLPASAKPLAARPIRSRTPVAVAQEPEAASGCGSGAGWALFPPLAISLARKRRRFLLIGLLALIGALAGSCNRADAVKVGEKLAGTWTRSYRDREFTLILAQNGGSFVNFQGEAGTFPGSYEVVGKNIRFVDLYCGKKLPGIYSYSLSANKLTLNLIDDPSCTRNRYYPGVWKRIKHDEAVMLDQDKQASKQAGVAENER